MHTALNPPPFFLRTIKLDDWLKKKNLDDEFLRNKYYIVSINITFLSIIGKSLSNTARGVT